MSISFINHYFNIVSMHGVNSFLVDWAIRFLESKDTIRKSIVNIKKKDSSALIVSYKDKTKYFIVKPILEDGIIDKIKDNEHVGIVTLNNDINVRFIVKNWEKFSSLKFLSIYFINPFSDIDKAWILSPFVHDKICDKDSLEIGLKSMSEMVDSIGYTEMEQKLKS